jgi:hypothetical protein
MKLNKNFLKISRKTFFLKYLKNRGIIKTKDEIVENQSIDLKDLLNENKIRITYSDIFRDWLNFRRAYYWRKLENLPVPETKIPFEKKDMTIKNFIQQIFASTLYRKLWKYFLIVAFIFVYVIWRIQDAERRNIANLKKLGNMLNEENKEELNKYKKFI